MQVTDVSFSELTQTHIDEISHMVGRRQVHSKVPADPDIFRDGLINVGHTIDQRDGQRRSCGRHWCCWCRTSYAPEPSGINSEGHVTRYRTHPIHLASFFYLGGTGVRDLEHSCE